VPREHFPGFTTALPASLTEHRASPSPTLPFYTTLTTRFLGIPVRNFALGEKNASLIWRQLHAYLQGEAGPQVKVYLFAKGPSLENRVLDLIAARSKHRPKNTFVVREAEELLQVLYALSPLHHVSYVMVKDSRCSLCRVLVRTRLSVRQPRLRWHCAPPS
jgi:hypothetical protein